MPPRPRVLLWGTALAAVAFGAGVAEVSARTSVERIAGTVTGGAPADTKLRLCAAGWAFFGLGIALQRESPRHRLAAAEPEGGVP